MELQEDFGCTVHGCARWSTVWQPLNFKNIVGPWLRIITHHPVYREAFIPLHRCVRLNAATIRRSFSITGAPRWKKCLPRPNWSTAGTVPSPFRRSRTGVRSARVQASSNSGRRSFTRKLLSQPTRSAIPRYWFDSLATRKTSASLVLLGEASPQPFLRTSFALARLPRASRLSIFSITVRYLLNETTSPRLDASASVALSFSSILSSFS